MEQCDIKGWVDKASGPTQRELRQAVHTILLAIAGSPILQPQMVMKGAVLLALRYDSTRYTRDIDFSTDRLHADFDDTAFRQEFERRLALAVDQLQYELDCRIQSVKINPKKEDASFPTLTLKVAYALKGTKKHKNLLAGNCSDVVEIDYSFNEPTSQIDALRLDDGAVINAYSFIDLVAEKLRAILQQEIRNRVRRQDAYDLFRLFSDHPITDVDRKLAILKCLREKANSRGLHVHKGSMADSRIVQRSQAEYGRLQDEIEEKLPPFETVYGKVRRFYESLPWE